MSLEPLQVGSIKDHIVCAVWALGELATRERLNKAVQCSSHVLAIAIEGLQRDGYIYVAETGNFVLHKELAATLNPADRKATAFVNEILSVATPAAPTALGDDMVQKKRCTGKCGLEKDAVKDFYAKSSMCKRCTLDRQKELKATKAAGNTTSPKQTKRRARTSASQPIDDEFVIPAAGHITCRVVDVGAGPSFCLQQHDDQIAGSIEQLQVLRDWASSVIKKASAS